MAILKISTLKCRGQTIMMLEKQLQIQYLLKTYNFDILMCQETLLDKEGFNQCEFIENSYNIITNNFKNEYGTCCFVKNLMNIYDIKFDTAGRVIIFNIENITFLNIYPKAGTDPNSRKMRENLF